MAVLEAKLNFSNATASQRKEEDGRKAIYLSLCHFDCFVLIICLPFSMARLEWWLASSWSQRPRFVVDAPRPSLLLERRKPLPEVLSLPVPPSASPPTWQPSVQEQETKKEMWQVLVTHVVRAVHTDNADSKDDTKTRATTVLGTDSKVLAKRKREGGGGK